MRSPLIILALLLGSLGASAQTWDREHLSVGAQGRYSHVLDGHGLYERLLDSYDYDLYGVSLGLSTRPEDGGWFERAWNYPSFGLGFSYARMGSLSFRNASRLGDIANLYGWSSFDLLRTPRFRFRPLLELGLAFTGETYDYLHNPANLYVGSRVFALIGTGLRAEWLFAPQWSAEAGFYLTHHSNGMLRAPNLGINEAALGVGLCYYWAPTRFPVRPAQAPAAPEYRRGLQAHVFLAAGVHSCPVELDGIRASDDPARLAPARPRLVLGAGLMWRYAPLFASGIEVEGDYAANDYARTDRLLAGREDPRGYSPLRAGAGLVQEFWYRRLSVHIAAGVYLFKRSGLTEDVGHSYQKIGVRYHFAQAGGLFAGLDMRAHQLDRSYSLEWSAGWRF